MFVNGPESQPLQVDLREACVAFPASGRDTTESTDIPQGRLQVTCVLPKIDSVDRAVAPGVRSQPGVLATPDTVEG
jgi:hypothetical protein